MAMNNLARIIEGCMSRFETDGQGNVSARFVFPGDFLGFQGHFPDNPVLPGVCMLQAVMVMAGKWAGTPGELKSLVLAKWFAPTGPGAELDFLVRVSPNGAGGAKLKTKITRGGDKVAELILAVQGLKSARAGCL